MEAARVNGLKKEEERERMKREANLLAAEALNKQIQEQNILREQKFNEKRKVRNNLNMYIRLYTHTHTKRYPEIGQYDLTAKLM